MALIYMRTSPSGGRYVGKTIFLEEKRWEGHCAEARCQALSAYNNILNRAIRKYGENNFTVEILEDNIPEDKLNDREIYWIENKKTYYLDNCHGYNMTRGGEGIAKINHSQVIKLWNQGLSAGQIAELLHNTVFSITCHLRKEHINPEEIKKRGQKIAAEKNNENYQLKNKELFKNFLKFWNEGLLIKDISERTGYSNFIISNALKNLGIAEEEITKRAVIFTCENKKERYQNSENSQLILHLWNQGLSIKEINLKTGINKENISYALDFFNISKEERIKRGKIQGGKTKGKKILQYDLNNNFIREWSSIAEAGRALNICTSGISRALNGKIKTSGNFIWKQKEN